MKLQIVSDLHIETKREHVNLLDYVTPVGDVLVLAGDIGSMYRTRQLCNLLEQACNQFPLVILYREITNITNSEKIIRDLLQH